MSNVFKLIGLFVRTDENLVLINSFGGRRYNDSPKVISEYLTSHDKYKKLDIVWALEKLDDFDIPNCRKVKMDSFNYFFTALKAKYWITNVNIERGLHFKKNTTRYLNTWHGLPFNSVGNAVNGRKDFDCSNVDIFLYEGQYEKKIFLRDFNALEKKMICTGLPRNDELYFVTDERIAILREKFDIPEGKKVILYAPTWRDSIDNGKTYVIKPPINLDKWQEQLGDKYIIFFRAHHFTTKLMNIEFNDFVRDASNYPEINELMIAADILISDYSAMLVDYSVLERPIICFGYDYEDYGKSRGFYVDMNLEMPSGVLHTQEEVINHIKTLDYMSECAKTAVVKNKYLEAGGHATELCVKALFLNQ